MKLHMGKQHELLCSYVQYIKANGITGI